MAKNLSFQQKIRHFSKIAGHFSPTVPPFAAGISRIVADVEAPGDESGNV